ncbi:hypothetical protein GCM10007977_039110 [Dactylosporangium sucinum]|uniref:Uncharacterized protein n=1 Tax=Dactylosporangium sucinum TaxID=1424081 RepID=A0A917TRI8_9ACTN|nr:hypothetical protein GCM10007977_039110 [Dactylosporangium sucinum]
MLLAVVSAAALVCLAGSLIAYVIYDQATTPDRSTPEGVLEQYIEAKFNMRNESRAKLFECPSADLAAVEQTLKDAKDLEARFSTSVSITPASFDVSVHGDDANVQAVLNFIVPETSGRKTTSRQNWDFRLRHGGSWLICSATRVP